MDRLCELYGYRRIQTPVFEDTALFARTSGAGSDVVQKEMYTFEDRGGRSLTLRPEATAPICRAYVEHGLQREPQPQKLYTVATMYRYAAPQKGRYRALAGLGRGDRLGRPGARRRADPALRDAARRLGVADYRLELNSIGDAARRPAYLQRLREWLADHDAELDEDTRAKAATSPLRVFDNLEAKPQPARAALAQAPAIGDALCEQCREHFAHVRAFLDAYGVRYELVPTLVRGLDYYTRTTWEFVGPARGAGTIPGGGRYDGLVEEIGPPTPGVGFGAGIERLALAVEEAGVEASLPASTSSSCSARARNGRARSPRWPSPWRGPRLRRGVRRSLAERTAHAARPSGSHRLRARDAGRCDRQAQPRGRARRRFRSVRLRRPSSGERERARRAPAASWRDLMCGEVRPEHVGRRLRLAGWVDTRRDHGGLVFIDLRDRSGRCQLVVNPERAPEAMPAAHGTRNEFVLQAEGEVTRRAPEAVNPKLPTGEVELQVDRLEIVSRRPPLPFQLDEEDVDETLRLRYRWLDLRRPKLQRNIALRAQMVGIIRREMEAAGFLDIQTPILFKPTPEGARDFVVPSRLHKGRFYALPQSPQILKQLSMVAGFDRYYQIAICFRDEDLRADRAGDHPARRRDVVSPTRSSSTGSSRRRWPRSGGSASASSSSCRFRA